MRCGLLPLVSLLLLGVTLVTAQYKSCSGTTVIKDGFGTLTDHTGALNYSHPQYCVWRILPNSTDDNSQVAIAFDYFDSWGNATSNWFDFLLVKDGSTTNAPDLVWFYGQTLPPVVLTSGNAMTLIWYTYQWLGSNTGRGFLLNYSSSSCPAQCNWQNNNGYCWEGECQCTGGWKGVACDEAYCANDCGGDRGKCKNGVCECKPGYYGADCLATTCDRFSVFTELSVKNFSDHLPLAAGGSKEYFHSLSCSWLIQPKSKDVLKIHLRFSKFQMEENWDFVRVYNGPSTSSPLLANLTGFTIPPTITSSGPSLLVVMTTDTGNSFEGFTASYDTTRTSPKPSATSKPSVSGSAPPSLSNSASSSTSAIPSIPTPPLNTPIAPPTNTSSDHCLDPEDRSSNLPAVWIVLLSSALSLSMGILLGIGVHILYRRQTHRDRPYGVVTNELTDL